MSALSDLTQNRRDVVLRIFGLVKQRDFCQAERVVVELVEGVFAHEFKQKEIRKNLHMISLLYTDFNDNYLDWVVEQGGSVATEQHDLADEEEHDNYLLAHCKDPASMDDMLFEVEKYLLDSMDPDIQYAENEDEAKYHISCYQRLLQEVQGALNPDYNVSPRFA